MALFFIQKFQVKVIELDSVILQYCFRYISLFSTRDNILQQLSERELTGILKTWHLQNKHRGHSSSVTSRVALYQKLFLWHLCFMWGGHREKWPKWTRIHSQLWTPDDLRPLHDTSCGATTSRFGPCALPPPLKSACPLFIHRPLSKMG